jgi:hypothetical protein
MLSIKNITSKHYFFKQKKINIISMRKSQWLFLIGIIVLLASCSKATIEPQTNLGVLSEFKSYQLNKEEIVKNEEDTEDEVNNNIMFPISEDLKSVMLTEQNRKIVLDLIHEKGLDFVPVRELLEKNPLLKNYFRDFAATMTQKGDVYEAVIYVPNIEKADYQLHPLVSPGLEVEDDEAAGINDFIFSWILDEKGNYQEIVIGEEQALEISYPLFIITPHPIEASINSSANLQGFTANDLNNATASYRSNGGYASNEFKINHRYEGSGNSEFAISSGHIFYNSNLFPTASIGQNLKEDNGSYTWWKEIREVDKDDIGKDLSHWEQISDNWVPRDDYKMYFNTYERDWASTNKYLGQGEWEGATVNLEGRRTYLSEWYAFDPDNSVSKRMYIQTIWSDWAKDFTDSKGRLKIWRVN